MRHFFSLLTVLTVSSITVYGQYENVLDNTSTQRVFEAHSFGSDLSAGLTTSNNAMLIFGAGQVTNQNAQIGIGAAANQNTIQVSGPNAIWVNEGSLTVGDEGSGNFASVSGGALLSSAGAWVGLGTGSNNSVTVSGDGSRWENSGLLSIGGSGGHVVAVDGGARVETDDLTIVSNGFFLLGENGILSVDADFNVSTPGFSWANASDLRVGGELTGMPAGAFPLAGGRGLTLFNAGLWEVGTNHLVLGSSGEASELTVTNDAWVYVGEVTAADLSGSPAGGLAVASTNDALLSLNAGSVIDVEKTVYVGGNGGAQTGVVDLVAGTLTAGDLVVEAGSSVELRSGSKLAITGDFNVDAQTNLNWHSGAEVAVGDELSLANGLVGTNRTLSLEGGSYNPADGISLVSGVQNTFSIEAGGGITNASEIVVGGTGNRVLVSGTDAAVVAGTLTLTESGNSATVSEGGKVTADTLALEAGNVLNLAAGGTLEMTGLFNVGEQTNLNWTAGGELSVSGTLSGMHSISNEAGPAEVLDGGRHMALDGAAANWNLGSSSNLIVGNNAASSELVLRNKASLVNADGYIGWGSGGAFNHVTVTDADTSWVNAGGHLYVGVYGSGSNLVNTPAGNSLTVSNEAWVYVGEAVDADLTAPDSGGLLVASTSGAELVVGGGTVNVEQTLYLGVDAATTGTNIIRNGGVVSAGDLEIATGSLLDVQRDGTFAVQSDLDVTRAGFNWGDGAAVEVGGDLSGMATTNLGGADYFVLTDEQDVTLDGGTWNEASGGNLMVGVDQSFSDLVLKNTGTMSSATTYLGFSTNAHENSISIQSGSSWVNTGDFYVGAQGSSNLFEVLSGGQATIGGNAVVGHTNGLNNRVEMEGSNSLWSIGGNLLVGNGGTNNSVQLVSGAQASVTGDVTVASGGNWIGLGFDSTLTLGGNLNVSSNAGLIGFGTFELSGDAAELNLNGTSSGDFSENLLFRATGSGTQSVNVMDSELVFFGGSSTNRFDGFEELNMTDSTLSGYGRLDSASFGAVSLTGSVISPSGESRFGALGRLEIEGDFEASDSEYFADVFALASDELAFLDTAPSLTGLTVNVHVHQIPQIELNIISGFNQAAGFSATNLTDNMLLYDAMLVSGSEGVSVEVFANNKRFSSALAYAGMESVRGSFNAMKGTVAARTKQLRRNMVSTPSAITREAYLLSAPETPQGAPGPGEDNTIFDMNIWAQHFTGRGDFDADGVSHGYKLFQNGTTFGADRAVGDGLIVGLNYTYALSSARTTDNDKLDAETYWLGAYGEWVSETGLYLDTLAAWGRSNFDTERVEASEGYRGRGSYRGNNLGAFADVGQYFHHGNLALSPYAGLHYVSMDADAYTEVEATNRNRTEVSQQEQSWLEVVLGLKARQRMDTRSGRFQLSGYIEYAHDLIQEDIFATLSANGLPALDMATISPDSDVYSTGLGISWIFTDNMEIGVGYNGRFSDRYEEHSTSASLNVMF